MEGLGAGFEKTLFSGVCSDCSALYSGRLSKRMPCLGCMASHVYLYLPPTHAHTKAIWSAIFANGFLQQHTTSSHAHKSPHNFPTSILPSIPHHLQLFKPRLLIFNQPTTCPQASTFSASNLSTSMPRASHLPSTAQQILPLCSHTLYELHPRQHCSTAVSSKPHQQQSIHSLISPPQNTRKSAKSTS